ncbi:MAG: YraN family protein [Ruminococcus sp.]|nr:YraN family protein [Ruminococcus sp.]
MKTTEIGRIGEEAVCTFLQKNGYKIVCRNYRISGGEIDIIAENNEYRVFVEVKTRKSSGAVKGIESVTSGQQKRIICTAINYDIEHESFLQPRYDIAGVVLKSGKVVSIDYLENAFDATGLDMIF